VEPFVDGGDVEDGLVGDGAFFPDISFDSIGRHKISELGGTPSRETEQPSGGEGSFYWRCV
jgi:hypothetical protein